MKVRFINFIILLNNLINKQVLMIDNNRTYLNLRMEPSQNKIFYFLINSIELILKMNKVKMKNLKNFIWIKKEIFIYNSNHLKKRVRKKKAA